MGFYDSTDSTDSTVIFLGNLSERSHGEISGDILERMCEASPEESSSKTEYFLEEFWKKKW